MTTATLPQVWRGRSGRTYVPGDARTVRHGGMASVRKIVGRGGPVGTSTVPDGFPLALKLWNEGEDEALDQLQAEARILVELSAMKGELPCPRLYDLVGSPVITGLVMEWCPADLERWWREKLVAPDAFGRLMAALAEATRRLGDYHAFYQQKEGVRVAHGDLKPSNVLIDFNGRWVISDFGAARVKPPKDNPLATSRVIAGTENFISPEALFHANKPEPEAMDTWGVGATLFGLLTLRRLVLDGAPVPRNGTSSPRFRTARMHAVLDMYGREPTRFSGRDLDPSAFGDEALPEADRRALRDALRGVFGSDGDPREEALFQELVPVLDRALRVEPARRYTDASELAGALEHLARTFIALSAITDPAEPVADDDSDLHEMVRQRDEAWQRSRDLGDQVAALNHRIARIQRGGVEQPMRARGPGVPVWAVAAFVALFALQVVQLLAIVALAILVAT